MMEILSFRFAVNLMKKLRGKMMLTKQIAGAESIVMKLFRKSNNFMSETSHVIVDDMQIC